MKDDDIVQETEKDADTEELFDKENSIVSELDGDGLVDKECDSDDSNVRDDEYDGEGEAERLIEAVGVTDDVAIFVDDGDAVWDELSEAEIERVWEIVAETDDVGLRLELALDVIDRLPLVDNEVLTVSLTSCVNDNEAEVEIDSVLVADDEAVLDAELVLVGDIVKDSESVPERVLERLTELLSVDDDVRNTVALLEVLSERLSVNSRDFERVSEGVPRDRVTENDIDRDEEIEAEVERSVVKVEVLLSLIETLSDAEPVSLADVLSVTLDESVGVAVTECELLTVPDTVDVCDRDHDED